MTRGQSLHCHVHPPPYETPRFLGGGGGIWQVPLSQDVDAHIRVEAARRKALLTERARAKPQRQLHVLERSLQCVVTP